MNNSRNAVIICTERDFEWKSRLLVRSIRRFGGDLSSVRIVSYSPLPQGRPSLECLDEFRSLDVETVTAQLNEYWPEYKLANKVVACAHAEQTLNLDKIAFLDSDQIVVSSFKSLFETTAAFAARPVDVKNIGFLRPGDEEASYWDALYRVCGVASMRTVQTTVCGSLIREYFDSGMFSVSSHAKILTKWKRNFALVWSLGLRPIQGDYFVEQSCLSATASALVDKVEILPVGYDLPVDVLYRKSRTGHSSTPIGGTAVSLHYHRLFDDTLLDDVMRFASNFLEQEHCSWIRRNVNELLLSPTSMAVKSA